MTLKGVSFHIRCCKATADRPHRKKNTAKPGAAVLSAAPGFIVFGGVPVGGATGSIYASAAIRSFRRGTPVRTPP